MEEYEDLIGQDRNNIRFLLNPNFDQSEVNMRAAEGALGMGTGGSGFASGGRARMLDSERISRFRMGNEMLQPYLGRAHTTSERLGSQAHDLDRLAREGAQAMERLQLSEAGAMSRLNAQERARLEQIAEQGRQAMQQLTLREAGETQRTRITAGANLAASLLSRVRGGGGTSTSSGPQPNQPSYSWTTDYNTGAVTGGVAPPPSYYGSQGSGSGAYSLSAIDRILRQYGVGNT